MLILFLVLFYGLQRYIVYGQDGVYLDFNQNQTEQVGKDVPGDVSVDIVYDDPDYSDIQTTAGQDLEPIKALYLSSDAVTAENLADIQTQLAARGANALVLEMKNPKGVLSWYSSVPLAVSYGTNGTADLSESISKLKDSGIYLVARISCCVDEYMALRNSPVALATSEGRVYSDDNGMWLDPSNSDVQNYVIDLSDELIDLGFDEILLANFAHPTDSDGTSLSYSQQSSVSLTPKVIISSFALSVREAVEAKGGKLSVLCDANSFRNGLADQTGQDPDVFGKVFDRYYWTTDASVLTSDMAIAAQSIPQDSLSARFVPIMFSTDSTESWVYPYE
ncbi:MAG: putative glycoside hydrolase [Oscillospiraceae bacterium]